MRRFQNYNIALIIQMRFHFSLFLIIVKMTVWVQPNVNFTLPFLPHTISCLSVYLKVKTLTALQLDSCRSDAQHSYRAPMTSRWNCQWTRPHTYWNCGTTAGSNKEASKECICEKICYLYNPSTDWARTLLERYCKAIWGCINI